MPDDFKAVAITRTNVHIKVIDAVSGRVLTEQRQKNRVVDSGLNLLRDALRGGGPHNLGWIAFGSGTTAPSASDTALESEIAGGRFIVTAVETNPKQLIYSAYLTESDLNGSSLGEIGLFTAASGGILYCRVAIASPIAKQAGQAVSVTWTLGFANA